MKSKIKGCTHHKTKVIQRLEDGGAVTPAVMPPAMPAMPAMPNGGGRFAQARQQFKANHPMAGRRTRHGEMNGGMGGQKPSQWKNTGPTMVNKNTA